MADGDRPPAVERTVDAVRAAADLPEDDGDVAFAAPWQARAFAMVVRLRADDRFDWPAFQSRLVEELQRDAPGADATANPEADTEAAYYERWLAAFERLLVEEGVVGADELAARAAAFAAGERDAGEFVHGDGAGGEHGHGHDHGHHPDDDTDGHDHHGHHDNHDNHHGHHDHGHHPNGDGSAPVDEPVARDPPVDGS